MDTSTSSRSASVQPSETSVPEPCSAPSEKYLLLDTEDELELHADDKALNVSEQVGPCLPSLWRTNALLLVCSVAFFVAIYSTRSCVDGSTYPMPPNWVWLAFFVPVLLHQLWAEQEAVEVLLPCYKRHMNLHRLEDGFSLMGLFPSSEAWWLRVQQLLLLMSSVDVFTDTYFASTMGLGGTNACSHGRTQEIWNFWWRQSIFSSLPFVVPLDVLISASWTLMLLHLVVACATMVRKKGPGDRGDDAPAVLQ
ncbi:unnamed protein product [Symbiodinium natans]|uniref:Uncharacterized protein n=1 Tax=Symbiodinium natans TaxID=878477 RepID=A0A812N035_9DINO|nr:unnamed protein product [Symbiodinium natans]